jgi:hypothetical protein
MIQMQASVTGTPGVYSGGETVSTAIVRWIAPLVQFLLNQEDRTLFERLVEDWKNETRFSSAEEMAAHWAYRDIIAMGDAALPFIMERLAESPDHWHFALTEITQHDPVPEDAYGDLDLMAQAWLGWWDKRTG